MNIFQCHTRGTIQIKIGLNDYKADIERGDFDDFGRESTSLDKNGGKEIFFNSISKMLEWVSTLPHCPNLRYQQTEHSFTTQNLEVYNFTCNTCAVFYVK